MSLTQSELKELLFYNQETGVFTWRVTRHSVKAGDIAGSNKNNGYRQISVNKNRHYAHRLAWFYVNGVWPADQIDHINRVKDDNKIDNLRMADSYLNNQNRGISKNNTSGVKGVCWIASLNKWHSRIKYNGTRMHIGYYNNFPDAKLAREIAELFCTTGEQA